MRSAVDAVLTTLIYRVLIFSRLRKHRRESSSGRAEVGGLSLIQARRDELYHPCVGIVANIGFQYRGRLCVCNVPLAGCD